MKTSRSTRIVTAIVALFSLLFMQLAVAAYACPTLMGGAPAQAAAMQMAPDMPGCTGMDQEQPSLCHAMAHGDLARQSLDKAATPEVAPFIPTLMFALAPVTEYRAERSCHTPLRALARNTSPPLAIRHCRFLI